MKKTNIKNLVENIEKKLRNQLDEDIEITAYEVSLKIHTEISEIGIDFKSI